jgi:pimeloyl-ACP methyl ester carboxylesterase
MTTFGLVHGGWHGAWCWQLLAAELDQAGHRAVAVDLPCEDWEAGLDDNADVVAAALDGVEDDVVLVGHALGGITIPVVAARRPVTRLVFLCALLPEPGRSLDQTLSGERAWSTDEWLNAPRVAHEDGSVSWEPEGAMPAFYHDCPEDLARWAASKLRRQVWKTTRQPSPLERWPDVPSSYVLFTEDQAIAPKWARQVARERLGVEAIELAGGHSPMLSRPQELAGILNRLTG